MSDSRPAGSRPAPPPPHPPFHVVLSYLIGTWADLRIVNPPKDKERSRDY